jgi:hypothetical protein
LPRPGVTAGGRLIRSTAARRRARGVALRELLEGFDAAPLGADDAPEVWEAVRRGIDEGRPHRPLFGGGAGG